MAKTTVLPENNRDAKKHVCSTPHLEGHVCSNNQGKALEKLMQKKKMTVEKFSETSSILVSTLNKVISGHSRLTTKGMLKAAKALQMSPFALTEACLNESRIFKAA
jgi:hypothetical protein